MNETDFLHWGTHVYTHMYMKPKLIHLLLISIYSNKYILSVHDTTGTGDPTHCQELDELGPTLRKPKKSQIIKKINKKNKLLQIFINAMKETKKSTLLNNNKGESISDKIVRKGLFEEVTSELRP